MEKISMEITGMSYSQSQSGAYALILGELKGQRKLPIIIGTFEAQSIALGMEKMQPLRPMTHDLFKNFADFYHIHLKEIIINKFEAGVFHAILVCENNNTVSEIDARTSDAVALAIRFQCPIYTYESVLSEAGILFDDDKIQETGKKSGRPSKTEDEFSEYLIEELEEMLQIAVEKEAYEKASRLRDEIKRRKRNL
ncbi:MAG: bifunctional nuclease family protein [Bacteroidetes bacterium]|nr:bifunctional nuclease family protein [Bacteroidota bacterium]MBU1578239.1 bifunctional nuclease family protein [Bacteroidota bacterium]MBU2556417.1 bifunctional nuclease family protein [Bacteroidota bacterium]